MDILVAMVLLLILAMVVMPSWPYSARWTYVPTGICGALVAGLAALVLVGRL